MRNFKCLCLLAGFLPATALADPVYVMRPKTGTASPGVLPQDAFEPSKSVPGSGNNGSSNPSTPPSDGFVFKSESFGEWGVGAVSRTVSVNTVNMIDMGFPIDRCDIEQAAGKSGHDTDAYVERKLAPPGSQHFGIKPVVVGKMGIRLFCAGIDSPGNSTLVYDLLLTSK